MRHVFVAGFVVYLAAILRVESIVIPLVDPADPIQITNATIEIAENGNSAIVAELENEANVAIGTRAVWVKSLRFYTRSEVERAGDRKVWDCERDGWAGSERDSQTLEPHRRVTVRIPLGECGPRLAHEHFAFMVDRIGARYSEPQWRRETGEFTRLLTAAMPHE